MGQTNPLLNKNILRNHFAFFYADTTLDLNEISLDVQTEELNFDFIS